MSDGLRISLDLVRIGDKWGVLMRTTGYEDDLYEYDSEEQARAALKAALAKSIVFQAAGDIGRIVVREKPVQP